MFSRGLLPALVVLLWTSPAWSQATLGALLDAGAKPLSPAEFKQELVQRTIVGISPAGGTLEVMYASNGTLHGIGSSPYVVSPSSPNPNMLPISGAWTVDEMGRICTSMQINPGAGRGLVLPTRCQFWFKSGSQYFFADSDTDRSAKVLSRTIKQ